MEFWHLRVTEYATIRRANIEAQMSALQCELNAVDRFETFATKMYFGLACGNVLDVEAASTKPRAAHSPPIAYNPSDPFILRRDVPKYKLSPEELRRRKSEQKDQKHERRHMSKHDCVDGNPTAFRL